MLFPSWSHIIASWLIGSIVYYLQYSPYLSMWRTNRTVVPSYYPDWPGQMNIDQDYETKSCVLHSNLGPNDIWSHTNGGVDMWRPKGLQNLPGPLYWIISMGSQYLIIRKIKQNSQKNTVWWWTRSLLPIMWWVGCNWPCWWVSKTMAHFLLYGNNMEGWKLCK